MDALLKLSLWPTRIMGLPAANEKPISSAPEKSTDRPFPERFNMKMPAGLGRALGELATRQHTTRSEFVRRALIREVESNGVQLAEPERAI